MRSPEQLTDFVTKNPYLYGMPMLFPPNRISDASFEFEGRKYTFPVNEANTGCFVHGIMHETEFSVVKADKTEIELMYETTKDNPYLTFPHQFSVSVTYSLEGDRLLQKVKINNNSDENMPVGIGFHTTFNTQWCDECSVNADVTKEFVRDKKYLPTGEYDTGSKIVKELHGTNGYNAKKELSALFELGNNHQITMLLSDNLKIHYLLDEKYKYLMIFNTGSDGKYICIEPQSWISNCPNFKDREQYGFTYIKAKEELTYCSSIYCERK